MALLADLRRGWRLGLRSARLLATTPQLFAFPALGLLTLGAVVGAVVLAVPDPSVVGSVLAPNAPPLAVTLAGGTFLAVLVVSAVSTFFAVGLVHCTAQVVRDAQPSVRDGLRVAWRARCRVLVWALVSATVAVVLRLLERFAWGRRAVVWLLGFTWTVLTYFVVPVLALEDHHTRAAVAESARTFASVWGETVGGTAGGTVALVVGAAATTLVFAVALVAAGGSAVALSFIVIVFFAVWLLVVPVAMAVGVVVKTVLYLYARDGRAPPAFADLDLAAAHGGGDAPTPGVA